MRGNDQGDLAGFLVAAAGPNAYYLRRWLAATGIWQRLLDTGIAPQSGLPLGIAKLDDAGRLLPTAGRSYEADGPDGLPRPLGLRLSAAYPADALQSAFGAADGGVIGAQMIIGGASRLVRLWPIAPPD